MTSFQGVLTDAPDKMQAKSSWWRLSMNKSESLRLLKLHKMQELLKLDAINIRFRVYDLLFACYPELASALPSNRYQHPDMVRLLYRRKSEIGQGANALQLLIQIIAPKDENELVSCLMLFNQCLLKALRDVLADAMDEELVTDFRHLIEHRVVTAVGGYADNLSIKKQNVSSA